MSSVKLKPASQREVDAQNPLFAAHDIVRAAARALRKQDKDVGRTRLELCKDILAGDTSKLDGTRLATILRESTRSQKYYLIGALYVLLMAPRRRQRLAAFFTPPAICRHILNRATALGFDPLQHTALDPACGGAAFLVPLAELMQRASPAEGATVESRLVGVELEPGLARLSELFLSDLLGVPIAAKSVVKRSNALKVDFENRKFDLIISNPPYGRVFRPSRKNVDPWLDAITSGHVNTYALFVALALKLSAPNALVAMIIPTSFTAGPYFANLRQLIRKSAAVLRIDLIEKRSGAFLDVTQDTCIMYLRRSESTVQSTCPMFAMVGTDGSARDLGPIQFANDLKGEWALPAREAATDRSNTFFDERFETLDDYGYTVRTGYFVWNRSTFTNRERPEKNEVPLVWAHNVVGGAKVIPKARNQSIQGDDISFAQVGAESSAIIRSSALVLQRTTNRRQARRLIAGLVTKEFAERFGGYVTENHTIIILPKRGSRPAIPLSSLLALINSAPVDEMYRRVSGTVSISTKVLRKLPLPKAALLRAALKECRDTEVAVELAYRETVRSPS